MIANQSTACDKLAIDILRYLNSDTTSGITQVSGNVPESFKLYQNYPNQFNPVTKIKFDIPQDLRRETLA